jgi:predicted RNA-binding Zn-ribbon protein involved in translation (DUF1610 family)
MERLVMNHVCCSSCLLRFTPAVSAYVLACPECGGSLRPAANLRETVGFRLVGADDLPYSLPQAVAVAMPDPSTSDGR